MLTPRQAFKVAFLIKCASEGMRPEEAIAKVEEFCGDLTSEVLASSLVPSNAVPSSSALPSGWTKQAFFPALFAGGAALAGGALAGLGSLSSGALRAGSDLASSALKATGGLARSAAPWLLLLPIGLGSLLGYLHSVQKHEAEKVDPEEYQARELITAYRRAAEIARRKAKQKQIQGADVLEVKPVRSRG